MIIFNFILVFTVLFVAIVLVLRNIFFSDTNSALNRLNDARVQTEKKQAELEEKMVKCEEECRRHIEDSQKKAEEVMNKAIQDAEQRSRDILEKARNQSQEIAQKANEAKDKMRADITREAENKLIDIGCSIVGRMIPEQISDKFNESLYEDFLNELNTSDANYIKDCKEAEVITVRGISDAYIKKFKEIVSKKVSHNVEFTTKKDPSIMGGVMLRFGTLVLDGSIRKKLKETSEQMKKELLRS
ncbi:MAG: F0F1 ATP synthase subunit delta [Candidatus Omnitrophica bacterium]|nr:F0F1 ATP synthase subunit delta [Candidatus Omnitrophota bacterium]